MHFENEFHHNKTAIVDKGASAATHAAAHALQGVLATCDVTISCTFKNPILV